MRDCERSHLSCERLESESKEEGRDPIPPQEAESGRYTAMVMKSPDQRRCHAHN